MRFLFVFSAISAVALAQNVDLSGLIIDPTGAAVPGAAVIVTRTETGIRRTTSSTEEGLYSAPALPPGHYLITVQKPGFKVVNRADVVFETAQNARIDFELQVGTADEVVTVTADAPLINTTDASVSTVINRKFVENIPLNGRSMQSLITLSTGVVLVKPPYGSRGDSGEFSVNGQRSEANYFTVDGVSANRGSGPNGIYGSGASGGVMNSTALGSTHSMISLDALQEFRIQTNSYAAEYGRSPGAQVTLTSRSGTNTFHGTLFEYFRHDKLDANNWFSNRDGFGKTPLRQSDFGGTIGGPVWIPRLYNGRDRTFFFFSHESLRLRNPQGAFTVQVPDLGLRREAPAVMQKMLNAFPIPNGPPVLLPDQNGVLQPTRLAYFTSAWSNPASLNSPSIRIDHRLGNRMTVFGRFQTSPSDLKSRSTSYTLSNIARNLQETKVINGGIDNILTPASVNHFRFNSSWSSWRSDYYTDNFGGAQPITMEDHFGRTPPQWSQSFFQLNFGGNPGIFLAKQLSPQRQWNVVDSFSWSRRAHNFKFGVDYRHTISQHRIRQIDNSYRFTSVGSLLGNLADTVSVNAQSLRDQQPLFRNFSAFAQDEWKAAPNLSLSLGLRWDVNPAPRNTTGYQPPVLDQVNDFSTSKLAPQGTPLYQTDWRGFGPRLGVAYQLRRTQGWETVLRSGYGLFFDVGSQRVSWAFLYTGYYVNQNFTKLPFPLPAEYFNIPLPTNQPPYQSSVIGMDQNLGLPYSRQWNLTIEQRLAGSRSLTVGYVGSAGRRLINAQSYTLRTINPDFINNGLVLLSNSGFSDYHSLQAQFQQFLWRGAQFLSSYTWAHHIDNASTAFSNVFLIARADSDYDVRHNFQSALTYTVPRIGDSKLLNSLVSNWGADARITVQTASPLDPNIGTQNLADGLSQNVRPDLVPGQPLYVNGPQYPGGKALNYNAFRRPDGLIGNTPRNILRGFGVTQTNLSLRRDFRFREGLALQFRAEAFNVFNQPNFGNVQLNWSTGPAQFGRAQSSLNTALNGLNSLYQIGGPRSLQLALKLIF